MNLNRLFVFAVAWAAIGCGKGTHFRAIARLPPPKLQTITVKTQPDGYEFQVSIPSRFMPSFSEGNPTAFQCGSERLGFGHLSMPSDTPEMLYSVSYGVEHMRFQKRFRLPDGRSACVGSTGRPGQAELEVIGILVDKGSILMTYYCQYDILTKKQPIMERADSAINQVTQILRSTKPLKGMAHGK